MFDFWKEVIINDAKRVKALSDAKIYGDKKAGIRVERCADYESKYIVDKTVYRTFPTAGKAAEIELDGVAAGRAVIELGLSVGTDSEFARPWSVFKMPIVVEFDAEHPLADGLRLAVDGHIASVVDNKLVLADPRVCVKKAVVETADGETDLEVTANAVPAGTGEWILENLRFPTHVNTYVGAPNADDMPQMGTEYVQYAFEYCVPKRGFHGQGAVGEPMASVTHHIFYVAKGAAVEAFEAALATLTEPKIEVKDINENPDAETNTEAGE